VGQRSSTSPSASEKLNRFTRAERLGEACPVYNCHGLTFASRRTSVNPAVMPILQDDGFEQVEEKDAQVGDIVVYSNVRGEVVHSGFVVGVDRVEIVPGTKPTMIPRIWSKWGKGHEWVHPVGECPYLQDEGNFASYYRLLRWQPT
jgi:hypothetical protein